MRRHSGGFRLYPHRLCVQSFGELDAFGDFLSLAGTSLYGKPIHIKGDWPKKAGGLYPRGDGSGYWAGWTYMALRQGPAPCCFRFVKIALMPHKE